MSLLDIAKLTTGNQPQTSSGSSLLRRARLSSGEKLPPLISTTSLPEPQKKVGLLERAKNFLISTREKFKIAKPKIIKLPSGFNLTFTQPKTDFDLSPAKQSTSAQLTPQVKQGVYKEEERLETKRTSAEKLDWRDKVYDISKDPAQLAPFISDVKEIPELVDLLKATNRLRSGKANEEDAKLIKQYLEQQNRDSTFGYKVLDVISQSIPFGAELYLTGGAYTAGKKATTKGLKYLLSKAGKEASEELLEKFGYKVIKGVAGATVQAVATAPVKVTKATLEKQLMATLTTEDLNEKESVLASVGKSFIDHWVEVVSERSGEAIGLIASKVSAPIMNKLTKNALFNLLSKLNPGKNEVIETLFKRFGYNGVLNEMAEERVGELSRGILNKIGLSDEEFKLPSKDQLLVELVSFSVPGILTTGLSQALNVGDYTPQEIIDKVIASPIQDTEEGKALIKAAMEAKQQGQDITIEDPKAVKADVATSGVELADKGVYAELTPKQLESLKDEVKIGDSVKFEGETYKVIDQKGVAGDKFLIEGDNRRQKVIPKTEAVKTKAEKRILDNLNPTGGVLVDYTPKVRATIELGENITTLDKTSKKSANQKVIIYRGTSTNQKKIVPGDFVTTNLDLAKSYGENVIESEVKMSDVLDDKSEPLGKEYIYRPTKPVKVKPKVKAKLVPRSQVPVGEGKVKVSRLEARIKQSLGELSEEQIKDMGLAKFKEMNKKENIKKAAKYVAENPEEALDVLTGKIDAPKGILRNSILIAMQNLDVKDLDIATRLASLQSTRAGQEISVLTEVNKNLPVNILSDIIRVRTQSLEKRYGGKSTKSIIKGKVKRQKHD